MKIFAQGIAILGLFLPISIAIGQRPSARESLAPSLTQSELPSGAMVRVALQAPPQPRRSILDAILELKPPEWSVSGCVGLLVFSPDGKTVAGVGVDAILIFDASTGKEVGRYPLTKKDNMTATQVRVLRYAEDGKLLAAGTFIFEIRLWEVASGKVLVRFTGHEKGFGAYRGQDNYPSDMALSPDGRLLAASMGDHTVRLWDVTRGQAPKVLASGDSDWPRPFGFSPDGKLLVAGNQTIRVWQIDAGKEIARYKLQATTDNDKANGLTPPEIYNLHPRFVFLPETQTMGTALSDHSIALWKVRSGKEVRRFRGHKDLVLSLALSANGKLLVTGSDDKTVRLWEVVTGQEICTWTGHQDHIGSVAISPDGRKGASCSYNGAMFIWDVTSPGKGLLLKSPAIKDVPGWWKDLSGQDSVQAHRAFWAMAALPEETVTFLRKQLSPVPFSNPKQLQQLIAELNHDQFRVRKNAMDQLEQFADSVEPYLQKELTAKSFPLETRRRLEALLAGQTESCPKQLQKGRAVAILEAIGTPDSKEVLVSLARGEKGARITREAMASLYRLKKHND